MQSLAFTIHYPLWFVVPTQEDYILPFADVITKAESQAIFVALLSVIFVALKLHHWSFKQVQNSGYIAAIKMHWNCRWFTHLLMGLTLREWQKLHRVAWQRLPVKNFCSIIEVVVMSIQTKKTKQQQQQKLETIINKHHRLKIKTVNQQSIKSITFNHCESYPPTPPPLLPVLSPRETLSQHEHCTRNRE